MTGEEQGSTTNQLPIEDIREGLSQVDQGRLFWGLSRLVRRKIYNFYIAAGLNGPLTPATLTCNPCETHILKPWSEQAQGIPYVIAGIQVVHRQISGLPVADRGGIEILTMPATQNPSLPPILTSIRPIHDRRKPVETAELQIESAPGTVLYYPDGNISSYGPSDSPEAQRKIISTGNAFALSIKHDPSRDRTYVARYLRGPIPGTDVNSKVYFADTGYTDVGYTPGLVAESESVAKQVMVDVLTTFEIDPRKFGEIY